MLTRRAQQQTKRVIGKRDDRLKENREKADKVQETKKKATANGELSTSYSWHTCPDRRLLSSSADRALTRRHL